ncbi:hypothetical protein RWV98_05645 [Agathobaculum sp. NTUH-O15-33]|uniref:hypothetical protein n=1 Tax=Agathobaculum sp. NTUH-O15-33 TaxID=3079302 RepID=UPI0029585E8C|nr:hypothetical protein [Agathobaculum sp. NTUH-O15-33]WNX85751.1 hypothetical protein RWV98_05645 [Agathobaculum sp. NTUH-O15-33]
MVRLIGFEPLVLLCAFAWFCFTVFSIHPLPPYASGPYSSSIFFARSAALLRKNSLAMRKPPYFIFL